MTIVLAFHLKATVFFLARVYELFCKSSGSKGKGKTDKLIIINLSEQESL